ncbi:hypothetical protein TRIHO_05770 [Tritonibacter horizontis]|uniref:Uncharacterized protein n=1 Tax=Tritonibacter horizontis TaxID=1768241 RepID=A0A132C206_9RHOB|nr:hypothetical protein TRIHO_05770 [Tritonibacter horizontis]
MSTKAPWRNARHIEKRTIEQEPKHTGSDKHDQEQLPNRGRILPGNVQRGLRTAAACKRQKGEKTTAQIGSMFETTGSPCRHRRAHV